MLAYFLAVAAVLAVLWGVYWLWRRKVGAEVAEGAASEYARLSRQPDGYLRDVDEAAFARVYARVQTPRFPGYLLGALTTFLVGTPVFLGLISIGIYLAERGELIAQPGEAASEIYFSDAGVATVARRVSPEALSYILQGWSGFFYYLGLLFFWVLIAWFFMSRYHRRTPGLLREEVSRSR